MSFNQRKVPSAAIEVKTGSQYAPSVTSSICQLRPESRGDIMIRSADPREHPVIRANYLDTENDRRTIVDGMKLNRSISRAPAFATYLMLEREPGHERQSDDDLLQFAREPNERPRKAPDFENPAERLNACVPATH